jgi:hypothetical protein
MVIELSDRAAARVAAAAAARGVTADSVIDELVETLEVPTGGIVIDETVDPLEAFFGCGDSGDPDWAGTDTRLLRATTIGTGTGTV